MCWGERSKVGAQGWLGPRRLGGEGAGEVFVGGG